MATGLANLSYISEIAQILGLENWDLQQASYNGCSFMTVVSNFEFLNPANGLFDALQSQPHTKKIFGYNSKDPNSNLYATRMHLTKATDKRSKKIVRRKIPNADFDVLQNMGSGGCSFTMNAVFTGENYLQALYNFEQAAFNDDSFKNNPNIYKVLVHPIWGKTLDVELSELERVHESSVFKGVTLTLQFECSNGLLTVPKKSSLTDVGEQFNKIQSAIVALSQTISLKRLLV